MRGLTKGEQSITLNPVLQVFTRSGELLVDPISGTFTIEDITDPCSDPVIKAGPTPLDLNDAPAGHKLGTGRFYIPTGTTTSWSYGTHRVVFNYVMVAAGRTYQQIVHFEVLHPTQYPTGQAYIGYAATSDLYRDGFYVKTAMGPEKLQPHIHRISSFLEAVTDRFFGPRYLALKLNSDGKDILYIDEAIVAVEKVEAVARNATGADDTSLLDPEGYRVFNRHLDGLLNPDDRSNPLLSRVADESLLLGGFRWPYGNQNLLVTGVFGFMDPEPQSDRVLIGRTPADFVQIIGALTRRYFLDPTLSSKNIWQPGRVKKYKTRDQMLELYGASGNVNYTGGLTGDEMIDQMLQRFIKPARLSYPSDRMHDGLTSMEY